MKYQVDYISALFCVYKGLEETLQSPQLIGEEKEIIQTIIQNGYKDISNYCSDAIPLIYNVYDRLINETKYIAHTRNSSDDYNKRHFKSIFSFIELGFPNYVQTKHVDIAFKNNVNKQSSSRNRVLYIKNTGHCIAHLNNINIKKGYDHEATISKLETALQLLFFLGKDQPSIVEGVDVYIFYKILAAKAASLNKETLTTNKVVRLSLVGCKIPQVKNLLFSEKKSSLSLIAGKSLYLQNLMQILSNEILLRLKLPLCNLIQIDGNQFYILAREEDKKKINNIAKKLIKSNKFGVPALIDSIHIKESKLNNNEVLSQWNRLGKRLYKKSKNLSKITEDWKTNIDNIGCFEDLSTLSLNKTISISKNTTETGVAPWQSLFDEYGWNMKVSATADSFPCGNSNQIMVNQPNYHLNDENFLGLMYLDIDNLGNVIKHGLRKSTNVFRQVALTSSLSYFCQDVITELHKKENPYVRRILFGGDEFAFIGRISNIYALIKTIKKSFDFYMCFNPNLTITGAITTSIHSNAYESLVELREYVSYMKYSGQRGGIENVDDGMEIIT